MKSMYVPMLLAVAALGLARADTPPAPATATSAGSAAAAATAPATATAAAAAPAAQAAAATHTPPKAKYPYHMVTVKGQPQYCKSVARQNSRIEETVCLTEAQYAEEERDSEQSRQRMLQGANGCAPACGK